MVVIETDGVDTFQSPMVDVVPILPAQRYSVLVTMNKTLDEYWIRISGAGPPSPGLNGLAILRYSNHTSEEGVGIIIGSDFVDALPIVGSEVPVLGAVQGRPGFQDIPWAEIILSGGVIPPTPPSFPEINLSTSVASRQAQIEADRITELGKGSIPTTSPVNPATAVFLDQMDCPPYASGETGNAPTNYDQVIVINVDDCPVLGRLARLCINGLPFTPGETNSLPALFQIVQGLTLADSFRPMYTPTINKVNNLLIMYN